MDEQLTLGLADLQASLRRIESLLEWKKLFDEERKQRGPDSPKLRDHSQEELQIELAWFYKQSLEMETLLQKSPADIQEKWQPKIKRVWQRYHAILTTTPLGFREQG